MIRKVERGRDEVFNTTKLFALFPPPPFFERERERKRGCFFV